MNLDLPSEPAGLCQRDGHFEDVREAGDEGGLDGLHQPQLPLLPPGALFNGHLGVLLGYYLRHIFGPTSVQGHYK